MSVMRIAGRLRRQRGVISLLTLAFMVGAGMTMLITLWGISRVTGAFNTLYTANEAASLAAVSASEVTDSKIRISCDQLSSENPTEPATICTEGVSPDKHRALEAASSVMAESLKDEPFGLCFDGDPNGGPCSRNNEVRLVSDFTGGGSWRPSIKIFNMGSAGNPAACRNSAGTASIPAGQDMITVGPTEIVCWGLREYGQSYSPNLNSGVITRAEVNLDFFPGCFNESLCPTAEIKVSSAASQDQPIPGRVYTP